MTLTFCRDVSAADWIVQSDLPWGQLVSFGPAGFDSYARLRFLPDPVRPGQSENDADRDGRPDQLPTLVEVLATHTATPDDCYFCIWVGFGDARRSSDALASYVDPGGADASLGQTGAQAGYAPLPMGWPSPPQPPKVVVPNRAFWLFHGPLTDIGSWDTAQDWPSDDYRLHGAEPAFIWPPDHAWCVAHDVDPHWAGIGGTVPLIARLMADPRLDVVPADPAADQPFYY
ncbi:MAG TPA: hypothetical protein VGO19_10200 [Actinomycetes bacterium]